MNFTFLHCADLHLGSPLLGLSAKDAGVAETFSAASRDAFAELVREAIAAKVAFVLIAGDVYDGEWRDSSIGLFFNREVSRLARAGIPVLLVKGNHDAASVVTSAVPLPETVTQFSTRKAETHLLDDLRVAVHGRSFPDRAVNENWAVDYPAPKAGWFNIGVLHTSCDGRPGHDTYAPCTIADMAARGYDYWALGHVHEHEILSRDPWIVYPGNLQGRSVRERGPKGAVLVDVADGRVVDARQLIVDRARFAEVVVDVAGAARDEDVFRAMREALTPVAASAGDRLIAARVRLAGETALHRGLLARRAGYSDDARATLQHLHHDLWLEKLVIETSEPRVPGDRSALASLDLAAMLDADEGDAGLRAAIEEILAEARKKLPDAGREDIEPEKIDDLVAEARALVLGRAGGSAEA